MKLVINGSPREYEGPPRLADLLERLEIRRDRRGLAVAVNESVVRRERYDATPLRDGDRIEVIEAVQGG
jgi:sulfur carrier protein